jgi:predicted esterase
LAGKGLFLSAGEHDPLMTPGHSKALYRLLQNAGASISMAWQPAQHGVIQSDVEMAAGWFNALIA